MNRYFEYQYFNTIGQLHCDGGPAVEWDNGTKVWYKNGLLHRDGGLPAIEQPDGTKSWYINGELHREGGLPVFETGDGSNKEWYVNGELHREGGLSAIEDDVYGNEWYIHGKKISEKQGLAYFTFCQKMQEKKRIRAQKKIYFWWIQICYDMNHPSGCGKRMAQKNVEEFESMMKTI